jgi:hypothetical protein
MKLSRLFLLVSSVTFASTPTMVLASVSQEALLQKINQRMENLENQVDGLKSQVKTLKVELRKEKSKHHSSRSIDSTEEISAKQADNETTNEVKNNEEQDHYQNSSYRKVRPPENYSTKTFILPKGLHQGFPRPHHAKNASSVEKGEEGTPDFYTTFELLQGGTPAFSSPYIGINSAYDGSDLIVNESSVNLDYRLLKQRQALEENLEKKGVDLPKHPVVEFSGKLEAQALYNRPHPGGNDTIDFDLATAALDAFIGFNPWVYGFIDLQYDNSPTASNATRVTNSRVFLRQGFVNIGNTEHTPFYASIGQLFVPFGQYSSYLVSAPLTQIMGRTKERAVVLGYRPTEGFYGTGYVFKGNTDIKRDIEGGGSLGIHETFGKLDADASVGIISNIAESEGMQSNGAPSNIPFSGFGRDMTTELLVHSVPGMNIRGSLSDGPYNLFAEYVRAIKKFDPTDMSFGHVGDPMLMGAEPQAFHLEGVYSFYIYGKPSTLSLGWDFTKQALALMLPSYRLSATLNVSPWKDTIASIEYRHDFGYGQDTRATGGKLTPVGGFGPLAQNDDALTFQFGVYF